MDASSILVPGFRLDRYELLCPLAQGGMAAVWIARQLGKHGFAKLVAVKMILPQFASEEVFQTMFLDEARIAAGIDHPNVAHIHDLGEAHGALYLAMELIDGDSITKLHRAAMAAGRTIPPAIVARMMIETCAGLHAAHELRGHDGELLHVVHRDVSPHNVLVNTAGISKVIDFGIAKARDRVADETNAGTLKGKVRYMAPEQAMGSPLDRRADVWAVGAMLYHLLANKLPFDAGNDIGVLRRLLSNDPPDPLDPSVPRAFADIVEATLVHDPASRIPSCAELQRRLEAALLATSLHATNDDVAAFGRELVGDRAKARKEALEVALAAAAERARVSQLLQLKENPDSNGQFSLAVTNLARLGDENPARSSPQFSPGENVSDVSFPEPPAPADRRTAIAGVVVVALGLAGVAVTVRSKPDAPSAPVVAPAKPSAAPIRSIVPIGPAHADSIATPSPMPLPLTTPTSAPSPRPTAAWPAAKWIKPFPTASTAKPKVKASDVDDGF